MGIVALAVLASGCASDDAGTGPGGGDENGSGENNTTRLDPINVVSKQQKAADLPTATNPFVKEFTLTDGYDEILIVMHVSGAGQYQFTVTNGSEVLYDTKQQTSSSAPDSHSTSGSGTAVETGNGTFTARMEYTGTITYHLTVTARQHGHEGDMEPHEH